MKTEQVRDKRTPSRSQSRPSGTGGTRCTYNAKQPTR